MTDYEIGQLKAALEESRCIFFNGQIWTGTLKSFDEFNTDRFVNLDEALEDIRFQCGDVFALLDIDEE